MTNETEAPERICVVNCGLPAMACACYRSMFASQFPAGLSDAQAARIAELDERNTALGEAVAYATQRIAELDRAVLIETNHVDRLRKERAREKARAEAAEAKLAKAVRLMELSVELADWNTTLLDDVIFFITELKGTDQ